MTREEAYRLIREVLEEVAPESAPKLTEGSHLTQDKLVDSLDAMNFLFEVEQRLGFKLKVIDEDFDDFRVTRLVDILVEAAP
jgi:acyl carrier protein